MNAIALLASVVGLYASVYFTLVYYGTVRANSKLVPQFCRMEEDGCMQLLHHRDARLFGLPNSLLGVVFYAMVIVVLVFEPNGIVWIRYAAWLAVAVSVYLLYSLFVIVKVPCPVCLIAHVMNIIIAISLSI